MNTTTIIVIVLLAAAIVAAAFFLIRRRRSQALRKDFGPEYKHALDEYASRPPSQKPP